MNDTNRFQFRITDPLLLTALIAGIVAAAVTQTPAIALATASSMVLFIWNRPVLFRLWTVGMIGLGAGLLFAGLNSQFYTFNLQHGEQIAWGAAMLCGSIAAFVLFQTPLKPR